MGCHDKRLLLSRPHWKTPRAPDVAGQREAQDGGTVSTMPPLRFTLSEDGVGALRDALACLNKFSDEVALEASKDKVCLPLSPSRRRRLGHPLTCGV